MHFLGEHMQRKTISVTIGNQKVITFETGKIARQAGGAVVVRQGDTMVFCTACASPKAAEDIDFLPLRIDYQEKFFAAGKTLGGFIKREGRPTEKETLTSRLIDRPLRPMFEDGYHNEVQVLSYVWSYDGINPPDPLAICGASAALVISEIPLIKPIAGVRVGYINGEYIVNPTTEQMNVSQLDLLLAGTEDAILMIEGYCDFFTEEQIIEAISEGHKAIAQICLALSKWQKEVGKPKVRDSIRLTSEKLLNAIETMASESLQHAMQISKKQEREETLATIHSEIKSKLLTDPAEFTETEVAAAYKKISAKYMRQMILDKGIRSDGRGLTDIRAIDAEISLLPRTHGSCLFTRGETQTMAVCTLGGESMGQRFEDLNSDGTNRFYLHYFFPPFSVGEVGRVGSPGRREVGHGKLAERALKAVVPPQSDFPYTIRLESNITESNGSSSMASVCGGCLAMMDSGVPIERPVAGIAMGLILEGDRYSILSDILGVEDSLGDMDFKIAGDAKGITAFQMDIKIEGITPKIMKEALAQAKAGRIHILQKMLAVCPKSKKEMSIYAPRIETMQVKPSKIAVIIGPGGKQIRAIIEETGVQIDINDTGLVSISSTDSEAMEKAKSIISGLVAEVEVGKTYTGKVTSVVAFGAFVEVLPGKEGLCHISELDETRINNIFDFIQEGDVVTVKVLEINDRGQLKLSRKALLPKKQPQEQNNSQPSSAAS